MAPVGGTIRISIVCGAVLATLLFSFVLTQASNSSAAASPTPQVVCLDNDFDTFSYRARPQACDYYDARAPLPPSTALALVITRKMHWTQWGPDLAIGRGQWHPKGAGPWTPAKVKLSRVAQACGHQVFTSVQLKIKFPGEPWPKPWGARTLLKRCT